MLGGRSARFHYDIALLHVEVGMLPRQTLCLPSTCLLISCHCSPCRCAGARATAATTTSKESAVAEAGVGRFGCVKDKTRVTQSLCAFLCSVLVHAQVGMGPAAKHRGCWPSMATWIGHQPEHNQSTGQGRAARGTVGLAGWAAATVGAWALCATQPFMVRCGTGTVLLSQCRGEL